MLYNNTGVNGFFKKIVSAINKNSKSIIDNQPMTAKGDIIYGGTSGAPTRLAKGTNGQVLTLESGLPTWKNGGGGGSTIYEYQIGLTIDTEGKSFVGCYFNIITSSDLTVGNTISLNDLYTINGTLLRVMGNGKVTISNVDYITKTIWLASSSRVYILYENNGQLSSYDFSNDTYVFQISNKRTI